MDAVDITILCCFLFSQSAFLCLFNSSSVNHIGCDKNFHKKCAYKIPNDCTRYWAELGTAPPTPGSKETWSGRPVWIDKAISSRPQVPHTFFVHSFKKPTACQKCKKLVSFCSQLNLYAIILICTSHPPTWGS